MNCILAVVPPPPKKVTDFLSQSHKFESDGLFKINLQEHIVEKIHDKALLSFFYYHGHKIMNTIYIFTNL